MSTPSGHFQEFPPSGPARNPILTPKERIAHAVQIASGLLASGHYTEENGQDYSPALRYRESDNGPACVVADSLRIVDGIMKEGAV